MIPVLYKKYNILIIANTGDSVLDLLLLYENPDPNFIKVKQILPIFLSLNFKYQLYSNVMYRTGTGAGMIT
jgi:hypothetical protein